MAYLREIETKCDSCKISAAKVELVDRWNGIRGKFCRPCGKRRLASQKKRESPDADEEDSTKEALYYHQNMEARCPPQE